jgi:hypothetical protein
MTEHDYSLRISYSPTSRLLEQETSKSDLLIGFVQARLSALNFN